jgi:hypothetical protein
MSQNFIGHAKFSELAYSTIVRKQERVTKVSYLIIFRMFSYVMCLLSKMWKCIYRYFYL